MERVWKSQGNWSQATVAALSPPATPFDQTSMRTNFEAVQNPWHCFKIRGSQLFSWLSQLCLLWQSLYLRCVFLLGKAKSSYAKRNLFGPVVWYSQVIAHNQVVHTHGFTGIASFYHDESIRIRHPQDTPVWTEVLNIVRCRIRFFLGVLSIPHNKLPSQWINYSSKWHPTKILNPFKLSLSVRGKSSDNFHSFIYSSLPLFF